MLGTKLNRIFSINNLSAEDVHIASTSLGELGSFYLILLNHQVNSFAAHRQNAHRRDSRDDAFKLPQSQTQGGSLRRFDRSAAPFSLGSGTVRLARPGRRPWEQRGPCALTRDRTSRAFGAGTNCSHCAGTIVFTPYACMPTQRSRLPPAGLPQLSFIAST